MSRCISRAVTSPEALGKTLTLQGRDALTFAEAAERLARATSASVVRVPAGALSIPGAPSELMRTLHEVFAYYEQHEVFESEEAWRILGEPQVTFDAFAAELAASSATS